MYEIVPKHKRRYYTREEMKKKFNGKWLYLVNSEYTDKKRLIRAKVAVIADSRYGGREDGIYQALGSKEDSITSRYDLLYDDDDDWENG